MKVNFQTTYWCNITGKPEICGRIKMKLSEREWTVLDALWRTGGATLGELTQELQAQISWNRNTVFTYLTRMEAKELVVIDKDSNPRRYLAALSQEECRSQARDSFLQSVYHGSTGDLVAAFLKEKPISAKERERLRRLLDEMEV